jgi:glycosyltransferase involved in cell wall biosynthesis
VAYSTKDPPKLLIVAGGFDATGGGPAHSTPLSALGCVSAGFNVSIAYVRGDETREAGNPYLSRLRDLGIPILAFAATNVPGGSRRYAISVDLVRFIFRAWDDFDIVMVRGPWLSASVAALLRRALSCRTRLILVPHEGLTDFDAQSSSTTIARYLKRLLKVLYARGADAIIFSSPLEQKKSFAGNCKAKQWVIYHAIYDDIGELRSPTRHICRPEKDSTRNGTEFVVGYLGRLHKKKGLFRLVQALSALPSHFTLRIAGGGSDGFIRELRAEIHRLSLSERVTFLGHVDHIEKSRMLFTIDVLAVPSDFECFGMSAAEGMAAGVPVVCTYDVGVGGLIMRRKAGLVVHRSPQALAQALRLLEAQTDLRRELGRAARMAAEDELSVSGHGKRMAEALFDACALPSGREGR